MGIKNWLKVLIRRKKLEPNCLPKKVKDFYLIDSINIDTIAEETLLIYDCTERECEFEYQSFLNELKEYDDVPQPVLIFRNWDHERVKYWEYYDCLKNAAEKKEFNEWFDKKISIYTDITDTISLDVEDDGINYLEYSNNKENGEDLQGYIYNISFFELKKLFNVTGVYLFDNNVRYRLKKNSTGELLKTRFREYLSISLYNNIMKNYTINSSQIENICEILEIKESEEKNEVTLLPENFWFYHNGISIFCYDDNIFNTPANKIILPPEKVSVINGAQTLTNFFEEVEYIERNFLPDIEKIIDDNGSIAVNGKELIGQIMKDVIVKTIIIGGDNKYVRPITYGLNTQIPILEEAILANSDDVEAINKRLILERKNRIKILKEGEPWGGENGLSVLDFAKHWLTIKNQPGRSKNLGKRKLQELLEDIKEDIEQSTESIEKLDMLLTVYKWWDETKKKRIDSCRDDGQLKIICSYGKNYFGTYTLKNIMTNETIDDSRLILLYEQFEKDLLNVKKNIELSDFKKDLLIPALLKQVDIRKKNSQELVITNDMKEAIKDILSSSTQSAYTFSKSISHYLLNNNISIEYFRVISLAGGRCKEAFPFTSSTFLEIVNNANNQEYIPFENSLFSKEIEKSYPVFVITKNSTNLYEIEKVDYIEEFSFKTLSEQAKEVYEKTITAFEKGDESMLPRMSENLSFHVRPKAVNGNDTFQFTNGNHITKRTFWANKETVENIIKQNLSRG